jgi:hypothetical protein
MGHRLLTEQSIVGIEVEYGCAKLRHPLSSRCTDQVAHGIEGRCHVLIEQERQGGLDLALGRAGGQMQHAHVVPIGTFGLHLQRVIDPTEDQAGDRSSR